MSSKIEMTNINNLNFLRLLFATFVLITHSFALTGEGDSDFIYQLTHKAYSLSYVGVSGFFIISGFLIFKSAERSKIVTGYLYKRFRRIFPALFVVLFLTAFILAPSIAKVDLKNYYLSNIPYLYVVNNIQLFLRIDSTCIPGVFVHNPYSCTINGSLWTLSYELLFYFLLIPVIIWREKKQMIKISLISVCVILLILRLTIYNSFVECQCIIPQTRFGLSHLIELGLFFFTGSLFAVYNLDQKINGSILAIAVGGLIFSIALGFAAILLHLLLPILIIGFGVRRSPYISKLHVIGDYSYGTYLYGFPVQQTLICLSGMNYLSLMLSSIPISIIFGMLSWFFVEKKFLKLTNKSISNKKELLTADDKGNQVKEFGFADNVN